MKTLSTLKTLPLIGLLTMGLALAPVVSMADNDDRGRGKDRVYQKHDGGKGHYRDAARSHQRDKGVYNRGHGHKKGYAKGHAKGHKQVVNNYYRNGHKHHGHKHSGHGHNHVDHVVVHDHYSSYDPFRLMLGLHLDNIDIIYRDF